MLKEEINKEFADKLKEVCRFLVEPAAEELNEYDFSEERSNKPLVLTEKDYDDAADTMAKDLAADDDFYDEMLMKAKEIISDWMD